MEITTGSVLNLPTLALRKVIKMLDSNSLIILSQTCRLFNYLISQDFFIGISFPIDDEDMSEEIIRKKILKLTINIEGSCTLLDVNWDNIYVDVLEMRKPMQQLQNFNVEETFEVSVIINFREGVVSPQPEYTYKYVGELIKKMKKLRKYNLVINTIDFDERIGYVHYVHVHDLLKFSCAKEVVLTFPDIDMKNYWTPLYLSENIEKLVIIGPCTGLIGQNTAFLSENLIEIILKPIHKDCKIGPKVIPSFIKTDYV